MEAEEEDGAEKLEPSGRSVGASQERQREAMASVWSLRACGGLC